MRSYIFTENERRVLRRWLETGEEGQVARNLFVDVRRNMNGLTRDVRLLADVAVELRARNRLMGHAVRPRSGS
jgi:hypothetical protein